MGLGRCRQVASLAFLGALLPLALSAQSYGIGEQVLTVGAAAFRGETSQPVFGPDGYLYNANPNEDAARRYFAPLRLPNNAVITRLCGHMRNAEVGPDPFITVVVVTGVRMYPGGSNGYFTGPVLNAEFNDGYREFCVDSNGFVIRNDGDVDGDGNIDHLSYRLVVVQQSGATTGFGGVRIYWHREVSPSPAQPTFGDVAVDHPFFQYIEALAASAITGGCGNGNFCPTSNLTRGQMAVFLSKALGLHWMN